MSFTTKKYTRPVLTKAVRKINANNFTNLKTFVNTLSPRAGSRSAQVAALRGVLRQYGLTLNLVFLEGKGSYNKENLLKLLKKD